MPIALACPKCSAPQTVPDEAAGQAVRCPTCQAEFPADPAAPAAPRPAKWATRWVLPCVIIGLLLAGGAGLVAYQLADHSTPTDFTDPDGMFSARFPDAPEATAVSQAQPLRLLWGEQLYQAKVWGREYSVAILDGLNAGDELYGPATRDAHIRDVVVIVMTNATGRQLLERPADHEGHPAREVVFVRREDGRLTALRVLAGEHHALRLAVTGYGDKDRPADFLDRAGEFFNGVHVGTGFGPPIVDDPPAVSAADLAAAYKADPRAADAKYKDRWLRVTGWATEAARDGTEFVMEAGESGVLVRRAPPARRSVRLRWWWWPGEVVVTTGKCCGLDAGAAAGARVLLEDAIVAHPPAPKDK
jgi:hypothetical protein